MNIRKVIFLPMLALTILCGAAVLISSIVIFSRELDGAMHSKIDVAEMVVEHEIYNLMQNARVAAIGMASNPDLVESLINDDRDATAHVAVALQTMSRIDYCTILDENGIVITRTHEPGISGDSLVHLPHVKQALNGNMESYLAKGVTIPLGAYGGAPIYDDDMNIIGAVSLGFRLDNQDFVYDLRSLTGCEITVFLDDKRISSTVLNDDGTYALGERAPEHVSEAVLAGEQYIGKMQLFGKDVLGKYVPVYGADDVIIGMVFVGYYTAEDTAKTQIFILIGAAITMAVLFVCILIAGYISGIIERRLKYMMSKVREADEAAQKLVTAKEAAEQSNYTKGIFLAQMSHEIRTPMNAILGISEIQMRDTTLSPEAEDGYRKIYESGNLLLNIINDILDISKIDAGKMEIVLDKYDIPSLLNDTVLINRMRYESKPIEFNLAVDENTPLEFIGDELRIRQILNNLLSNAYKYTESGEVCLSISIDNRVDDDLTLIFTVSDTGQGMDDDQIARLFDEYTRFNIDSNRNITGTGLGMNITKRLVDLMDGEMSVKSVINKGTEFIVRLPQKRNGLAVCGSDVIDRLRSFNFQSASIAKKVQFIHEYMPYGRVLIVDDVESNLYVARGMMIPYGLHVDTANSGFAAIEMINSNPPYDIVFMDHMMPKMDGIQATKIIQQSGYTSPVVALTANAVVGQAEMFLANGFTDFIAKPIDSRRLDMVLKHYIRDTKTSDVIEAARMEQKELKSKSVPLSDDTAELGKHFVYDAENAVSVLNEALEHIRDPEGFDLPLYITTVHGIKTALANIGEVKLSGTALRLEQAGNENNFNLISSETPALVEALNYLIAEYKSEDESEAVQTTPEDMIFLLSKLNDVRTASISYNLAAIEKLLSEIYTKTWPKDVTDILDEISVYLLRGELKKIIYIVDESEERLKLEA